MPEHTTIPWDDATAVAIKAGDPRVTIQGQPFACDARILSEANYRHAVRCVNDHAAIVAALVKIAKGECEYAKYENDCTIRPGGHIIPLADLTLDELCNICRAQRTLDDMAPEKA